MIRSNVGNIVTNAMQVGSVAGTTYAGLRAHWNKEEQDTVLNNQRQQEKMQKEAERKERQATKDERDTAIYEQKIKNLSAKEQDILASASAKEELTRGRKARADIAEMRKEDYEKKSGRASAEEEFAETESSMIPSVGSPQWDNIDTYISNNVADNKKRMSKYSVKPSEETPWYKSRKGDKE